MSEEIIFPIGRFMKDLLKVIKDRDNVVLLKQKQVLQWVFGDMSFLPNKTKNDEDEWGRRMLKLKRPDLKLDKQWTNKFGEHIVEELYEILGKNPKTPKKMNHLKPDLETDEYIIEVKTQTYYTKGTAGEKILGTAFKYREVPDLYKKPLQIICIGGAEKICKENYGILSKEKDKNALIILETYKNMGIEYIGITSIFKSVIKKLNEKQFK